MAESTSPPPRRTSVLEEFHEARIEFYKTWGPALLLTLIGFLIAWFFVKPAPPDTVVIAAGPPDGAYYAFAQEYAEVFAENGVTLEIRETAGSIENYRLLREDDGVQLAIVQGGTAPPDSTEESYEAIASLYLEPVWIFTRGETAETDLRSLAGKRIAVGPDGSGTSSIALKLLAANGLEPDDTETEDTSVDRFAAVPLSGVAAAEQLLDGDIDAAFFVLSPQSELIHDLLRDDSSRLVRLKRHDAYSQLFPFLSSVTLAEGVIDLQQNLPPEPIPQIAPAANLICTPELHDAFIPLLLKAARRVHGSGDIYVEPSRFPSLEFAEFRPHPVALDYYESGPSLLQRHVPFWVASLIDRTKIMLLPLITLAIPLFKLAPPVYRWRIRSRIYRWYKVLREIDQHVDRSTAEQRERNLNTLSEMQQELEEISVPLSYMEEFYNLRLHIDLVRRRLESVGERSATAPAAPHG
ncbi:hypothetical protein Mal4_29880 [Maioricimonas rarisocia]|uniref:NMT1/THI5 like protein n=1 Tax=Maioricimonas rarisocia TaxID=2528026 RepID=A0A517Z847_9PLAN|nr:TAXI family TRAP transporter solute-binding subunit [Maioricimonas rarisocia]QDU38658.1 hypothetical protein Mal4_29880 [Maioricimonas rarisocia]